MNLLSMIEEKLPKEIKFKPIPLDTSYDSCDEEGFLKKEHFYAEGEIIAYNQALIEIKSILSKIEIDEEKVRMALLENIGWFMFEWEERPKSGKGSDRSDLLIRLARAIATTNILKEIK